MSSAITAQRYNKNCIYARVLPFFNKNLHICKKSCTFAPQRFCIPNLYIKTNIDMKKKLFSLALILFVCTSVMAEDVIYITTAQFRERIFDYKTSKEWKYKGDKPCVIDFYTTWCGPCKRLAPIMEELSQTYCDQVVFYKADTERERELAIAFGISSIPQVLYIPVEGKPMILKGLYPKENMIQIIDEFLLKKKK
jgi:thioredoxin